jgi:hypothetical protein
VKLLSWRMAKERRLYRLYLEVRVHLSRAPQTLAEG